MEQKDKGLQALVEGALPLLCCHFMGYFNSFLSGVILRSHLLIQQTPLKCLPGTVFGADSFGDRDKLWNLG